MVQVKTIVVHIKHCADALNPHAPTSGLVSICQCDMLETKLVNEWLMKKGKYLDRWYHLVEVSTK